MNHIIPDMTDPLGRHWNQPDRSKIQIIDDVAIMSRTTFLQLANYECSIPTGTYVGKMWRCRKMLRWYHQHVGEEIEIWSRPIKITMTDVEFAKVVIEWAKEYFARKKNVSN